MTMDITTPPKPVRSISLDDRLRAVEASLITWALKQTGGNKSRAAALLQIRRTTRPAPASRRTASFEIDDQAIAAELGARANFSAGIVIAIKQELLDRAR